MSGALSGNTNLTDGQRQSLRAACRQSLYSLVAGVICSDQKPNLLADEVFYDSCVWAEHALLRRKRAWGADPRGHAKSTRWTIGVPVWLAIQCPHERYDSVEEYNRARAYLKANPWLRGPDMRILVGSASKENSMRFARKIRGVFERNELFRWLFPELIPEAHDPSKGTLKWDQQEFVLPGRTINHPEPYVDTAGVTSRSTSRHYDVILVDDLIHEDNWQSETEIQAAIDWLLLAEHLLETPDISQPLAGAIFALGNQWALYDALGFVKQNLSHVYDIWQRACWRCSVHGADRCDLGPDCTWTSEPLWPQRFSYDGLVEQKQRQGVKIFSAQMENNPVDPDTVAFKRDQLRWCTLDEQKREILVFVGNTRVVDRRVPFDACRWFVSIDPATSTDPRSCRSAVGMFGESDTGDLFFVDLIAERLHPNDLIQKILDLWDKHVLNGRVPYQLGVESVQAQKFIVPAINAQAKLQGNFLLSQPPDAKSEHIKLLRPDSKLGKEDRIRNLLGWRAGSHTLFVNVALPSLDIFLSEWDAFPASRSNDVVDMLAYAQFLCRGQSLSSATAETNRKRLARFKRLQMAYSYGGV